MAEYVYGFVPFEEIPEFKMVRREEVVRCRDCKRFSVDNSDHDYRSGWWCKRWNTDMVKPDGFCAWGERKGVVNEQTSTKLEPTRTELKSCPFCGADAELLDARKFLVVSKFSYIFPYSVKCSNKKCGVKPYAEYSSTEQEAIAAWNRRAQ